MLTRTHGSKQKLKQIDSDFQLWTKDVSQFTDLHPDALLLIKGSKRNFQY
jgi:hypothetical protein